MSASVKTIFTCQKCDAQSSKWVGRCLECGAWGTLSEEQRKEKREPSSAMVAPGKTISLDDIQLATTYYLLPTNLKEVDRVLGGGVTDGGVYLLAGEPGIGKSTLVAQIAANFRVDPRRYPRKSASILYVSGEESPEQLKTRLLRLGIKNASIRVLAETTAETVAATIEQVAPALAVVDSAQTLRSAQTDGGAETHLRKSAAIITEAAKRTSTPTILIGQVTKTLQIAGPKSLEHLVDVVLLFEGDRHANYRLLRATKNRFGSADEVGIFEMTEAGLREVANPSSAFIAGRKKQAGSALTCILEGSRPLILELQSLVTRSRFPYPERRASGFEASRLNMLLAVLDKHFPKLGLSSCDVHLNVTSGLRVREPAADLAACLAIVSSRINKPLPPEAIAFGEVGLGGEIRTVRGLGKRLAESQKMGFSKILGPDKFQSMADVFSGANLV